MDMCPRHVGGRYPTPGLCFQISIGIAPTHRRVHFETVGVMRVQNGKITDHWGGASLLSFVHQIGGWIASTQSEKSCPGFWSRLGV